MFQPARSTSRTPGCPWRTSSEKSEAALRCVACRSGLLPAARAGRLRLRACGAERTGLGCSPTRLEAVSAWSGPGFLPAVLGGQPTEQGVQRGVLSARPDLVSWSYCIVFHGQVTHGAGFTASYARRGGFRTGPGLSAPAVSDVRTAPSPRSAVPRLPCPASPRPSLLRRLRLWACLLGCSVAMRSM